MKIAPQILFSAVLLGFTIAGGPSMAPAQTQSPAAQPSEDHSAHHPATGEKGMSSASPEGQMPMGMMGGRCAGTMAGDMKQMMSMMRNMRGMMSARNANVEGRIASLKTELQITAAQTAAWSRFADALRTASNSMNSMYEDIMPTGATDSLPVRMERREKMLSSHLTILRSLKDALAPLYASFSDDQKKRADDLMIGPMSVM